MVFSLITGAIGAISTLGGAVSRSKASAQATASFEKQIELRAKMYELEREANYKGEMASLFANTRQKELFKQNNYMQRAQMRLQMEAQKMDAVQSELSNQLGLFQVNQSMSQQRQATQQERAGLISTAQESVGASRAGIQELSQTAGQANANAATMGQAGTEANLAMQDRLIVAQGSEAQQGQGDANRVISSANQNADLNDTLLRLNRRGQQAALNTQSVIGAANREANRAIIDESRLQKRLEQRATLRAMRSERIATRLQENAKRRGAQISLKNDTARMKAMMPSSGGALDFLSTAAQVGGQIYQGVSAFQASRPQSTAAPAAAAPTYSIYSGVNLPTFSAPVSRSFPTTSTVPVVAPTLFDGPGNLSAGIG